MQTSVDIWALRDKVLHDDPSESSSVHLLTSDNKHAVYCGTDVSPIQINFFTENISNDSSLWTGVEESFDHVPGKEKDQVSPMFISEHECKTNLCRFCSLKTPIFFNNSLSLLNCMCIPFPEPWEVEKDLRLTF